MRFSEITYPCDSMPAILVKYGPDLKRVVVISVHRRAHIGLIDAMLF